MPWASREFPETEAPRLRVLRLHIGSIGSRHERSLLWDVDHVHGEAEPQVLLMHFGLKHQITSAFLLRPQVDQAEPMVSMPCHALTEVFHVSSGKGTRSTAP